MDGHNHIHNMKSLPALCFASGIQIVCATSPADWGDVLALCSHPQKATTHKGAGDSISPALFTKGVGDGTESAEKHSSSSLLVPSLGIHPWWASSSSASSLCALEAALVANAAAAVGEIGLDRSPRGLASCAFDVQVAAFESQCRLAKRLRRAASIHCVRAFDDLLAVLSRLRDDRALPMNLLFHSWAGTPTSTSRILEICGGVSGGGPSAAAKGGAGGGGGGLPRDDAATAIAACREGNILFSFSGGIVSFVVAEFVKRCAPAVVPAGGSSPPSSLEASGGGGGTETALVAAMTAIDKRCASAQTISVLAQLDDRYLSFETDAPDQGFDADRLCAPYAAWALDVHLRAFGHDAAAGTSCSSAAPVGHHCPKRTLDIIIAAAAWRLLKSAAGKKGFLPPWPSVEATAGAAAKLLQSCQANLARTFLSAEGTLDK